MKTWTITRSIDLIETELTGEYSEATKTLTVFNENDLIGAYYNITNEAEAIEKFYMWADGVSCPDSEL